MTVGTHRMRTPSAARRRRRLTRHGLIAGITTFLLLAGTGVSYAAWTADAAAKSTASAATLGISTAGFDSNAFTFQNHRLTTTGSVTLTNTTDTTSTTSGAFELTFGYTGSAVLAAKLSVAVWPTTNPSGCAGVGTPPSGTTVTGRWDTVATTTSPITGSLAKSAAQSYCVRVTAAERGELTSAAGALTIQPSISATLRVGNWYQSANSTTTQKTAWIFPAFGPTPNTWYQVKNEGTGNCLDVYGANSASGTGAIDYGCKTGNASGDYNQQWKFTRASGDYFDMTPRHAQAVRLDVVGGSTAALAAVDLQTDDGVRASQEWQLQKQPSGDVYQIVNRKSGLCLQVNNTSAYTPEIEYAQAVCDGTAGQRYTLIVKDVDVPTLTLSCAAAANGGVTFSWGGAAIDTYNFQYRPNGNGSWSALGDAGAGASSITVLPAAVTGAAGQYNVQALWLANQLATSGLWKTTTGGASALSCSPPVPVITSFACVASGSGTGRIVTCTVSPGATATYTVQAAVSTGSGISWKDLGTIADGTSALVIDRDSVDGMADGQYNLRVIDGSGNVLDSSRRITVGTDTYRDCVFVFCTTVSYQYPTVTGAGAATRTFYCAGTGNGSSRRVLYYWDLQLGSAMTFQADSNTGAGTSWTTIGTTATGDMTLAVTGNPPLNWSNATYDVRVQDGSTTLTNALKVRVNSSGQNKYLTCS